jgi:predicted aspartyl protease
MITGRVNAYREALIPLSVQDADGYGYALDAVIDTGYTGSLTLPPALIAALGLTWRGYVSAVLGDGSLQQFEVYAATVLWDG